MHAGLALFCLSFLAPRVSLAAQESDDKIVELASHIIKESHTGGGICVFLDCNNAALPIAVAKQGPFTVHCLADNEKVCNDLRTSIKQAGMYGQVSVSPFSSLRLPYMQNLVNLVVIDAQSSFWNKVSSFAESMRVLTPFGRAFLINPPPKLHEKFLLKLMKLCNDAGVAGLQTKRVENTSAVVFSFTKPWPDTIDEWGHYLHGADGNPVAKDTTVAPPAHYQWTGDPVWMRSHETDSSISTIVTARGRLFYIEDQAPVSLAGNHPLPDKWFLVARDAFNGVHLWKVPIRRWGWREWKHSWFNTRPGDIPLNIQKRLVAIGDHVFATLGYHAPVSKLDARTGRILHTYENTGPAGEILYHGGNLILSVYSGDAAHVVSVDSSTGKLNWKSKKAYSGTTVDYVRWKAMRGSTKPAKLDPTLNMATDGTTVALIDGDKIAMLDYKTGKEKWKAAFPLAESDMNAGGVKTQGKLWVGSMIVKHGVVVHASPNNLAGFSAETGKLLWTQPKRYIGHLWYEWKDVFVIDGLVWTWGADLERSVLENSGKQKQKSLYPTTVKGYDIHTGKIKKNVDLGYIFKTHHHHRCYRNKATLRYILASRRGTEYVDLKEGHHTVHNWVRGTCHVGMMPANGLQYAPAHPCQCYIDEKLNGMTVLAPAGSVEEEIIKPIKERLTKGHAYGTLKSSEEFKAGAEDWPTFRANVQRTGTVSTKVPADAHLLWRKKPATKVSAPVVVGNQLFAALIDEHQVVCMDTDSGETKWSFTTGARVDSPPTYFRGAVFFGSADGNVYCLKASDGALIWRFTAAPTQRMIAAFGQLESPWPIHGSVLIFEGKVYVPAGRTSQLDGGIYIYCLDAATGKVLHARQLEGPDYKVEGLKENFRLPMGSLPDILMTDGSTISMHTTSFDKELNITKSSPELHVHGSFLDGTYFKRMPWRYEGEYGRLIVHDKRSVYYVRMFDSLQGLNPSVYFTPGAQGYLLFGKNIGEKQKQWMERVPIRIRAMAAAGNTLFVAGPPDVVDPADPLGAFEGRKGGILYMINTETGEKRSETKLPAPPVFNGAAAARGRFYLSLEDGIIACYGKK